MPNSALNNWLHSLVSPNAQDRNKAWLEIRESLRTGHVLFSKEEIQRLIMLFRDESSGSIRMEALAVILALLAQGPGKRRTKKSSLQLSEWFWGIYQRTPSIVFFPFDPGYMRRDYQATIELARHVSKESYPNAVFEELLLEPINWGEIFKNRRDVGSLLIVGRLGMYGREAGLRWGYPNARLAFGEDERPANLARGDIELPYHSIEFRGSGGEILKRFDTRREDGKLIDYGLVQRYPVNFDARQIPVTICQGCSELGTLAAVQFAIDLDESAIRLKKPGKETSCFEALVQVSADQNDQRTGWRPGPKNLLMLFMDQYEYLVNQAEVRGTRRWLPQGPQSITIVRDAKKKPISIRLDGRHHGNLLQPATEIFQMVSVLCELSKRNDGAAVSQTELAQSKEIWGEIVDAPHVRRRYNQLRNRNLGRGVEVTSDGVQLHAPVRYEDLMTTR